MRPPSAPRFDPVGALGALAGLPSGDRAPALCTALVSGDERRARGAREDREIPSLHGTAASRGHVLQAWDPTAMNDQELQRLMNDRLDGVLTPEDLERLTRFLQSSETAQAEYQKLDRVFTALSQIPLEEAPADLKPNVLREIRLRSAAAPAREGWLGTIVSAFRVRPALRYAYSFAAGAALGVLAFAVISGNMMNRAGG